MQHILFTLTVLVSVALTVFVMRIVASQKTTQKTTAALDLRGHNRPLLTVALPNYRHILTISTPTKALADSCSALTDVLTRIGTGTQDSTDIKNLYNYCALILNGNLEKKEFPAVRLEKMMTPDDCIDFLTQYLTWLINLVNEKN